MAFNNRRPQNEKSHNERREEEKQIFSIDAWNPKTKLGKAVKQGEITSIEQIFGMGKPIKEVEIIDALLHNLESNILETASVQRMTKDTRKQKYRVTAAVGDRNGHVGVGVGKGTEVMPTIDAAIKNAKMHIISVKFGCGSWECNCGLPHSLPVVSSARCGSAQVLFKPAPRGVGIVAGPIAKAVLELSGIKDVWTFSRGRTRDIYNTAMATYLALKKISEMKNAEEIR
ncbi:MAG: 30S ribosomal protein S5 [Candidatus Micrarchaeaceae archaeon]